ncbi:MAG: hypothetical protein ABI894_06895 [Ilumatobacteraceae bacterium]
MASAWAATSTGRVSATVVATAVVGAAVVAASAIDVVVVVALVLVVTSGVVVSTGLVGDEAGLGVASVFPELDPPQPLMEIAASNATAADVL